MKLKSYIKTVYFRLYQESRSVEDRNCKLLVQVWDYNCLLVINSINNNSYLLGLTMCRTLIVGALQLLPHFNLRTTLMFPFYR